ncbi:MAG: VOC family protein [Bacteroidota bacterium]|nr:VOC family protein [Bacteroidota bacterium]
MKKNPAGRFEIPVTDMDRATMFYETVFEVKLLRNVLGTLEMAWFPQAETDSGSAGSLVLNLNNYKPSQDGILIYFTAQSGDLVNEFGKVKDAGGKILIPKRKISDEIGFMALILDTEGNRIALHSHK